MHPIIVSNLLITYVILPLVYNTFYLQLYQVYTVPMVNTMLQKTWTMQVRKPDPAITDDEQYYTRPAGMDILKYCVSKGHYCSLSEGLFQVQGHTDCSLALYFSNDNACSHFILLYTHKTTSKN